MTRPYRIVVVVGDVQANVDFDDEDKAKRGLAALLAAGFVATMADDAEGDLPAHGAP